MRGFFPVSSRIAAAILLAFAATACNYGLRGGGGFPSHIRTIYIAPLDNETVHFDVDQQIFRALTERLPRSLGIRLGGERNADAVVRGTVTRYEPGQAQSYLPGAQPGNIEVLQYQVQITLSLQIIDVRRNEILFEASGITGRGQYNPDTQSEDAGRVRAIELLIQQIIDGAQSQW